MAVNYNRIFNPEKLSKYNIDLLAINRVPVNSLVLELGCSTGFMGEYLVKNKKCKVFGIEKNKIEAEIAKKKLNGVLVSDIEEKGIFFETIKLTKGEKFDVILATSVLEHLKNPDLVLKNLKKILTKDGIIIISTPNIAHWKMRLSLLKGEFEYSDYGVLDNTHLRFFTIKSLKKILERNDFLIKEQIIDPEGGGFPRISIFLSYFFPNLFAYQILIVVKQKV